tara:strand:- start:284 stop:463 length:180 start_codon:yes stop_codon:yes gene_type:complete
MNKPLMFINNNFIVEQLKIAVWEDYKEVRGCDFKGWYNNLTPVEQAAWNSKFDEENERK